MSIRTGMNRIVLEVNSHKYDDDVRLRGYIRKVNMSISISDNIVNHSNNRPIIMTFYNITRL
jgi:hypothetical protein